MKDPPPGACCASAVDGGQQPGAQPQQQQQPGALSGAAPPAGGFDDDYNEWELGIGDLIIDLDADIEKSNDHPMASSAATAAASPPVEHQATVDKGLKMKIKRKNLAKHEIVKAQDSGASPPPLAPLPSSTKHSSSSSVSSSSSSSSKSSSRSGSHKKKRIENGASPPRLQCSLGAPPLPSLPAPPPLPPPSLSPPPLPVPLPQAPPAATPPAATSEQAANGVPSSPPEDGSSMPTAAATQAAAEEAADTGKRAVKVECPGSPAKVVVASTSVERRDSGVLCTSVGTITEPDCLGPCEPGTSVTLEGIVWQETEGGVLVVNVTWRGKTYVGTLLDCTRHDWAPPRFSPVQGKLRNGKGRRFAVPCSPAKNESRRRNRPPELELSPPSDSKKRARARSTPEAPCSPALILCPEPNCGKKYKHINGLRYHQSHAHGCGGGEDAKGADEDLSDGGDEAGSRPPSPESSSAPSVAEADMAAAPSAVMAAAEQQPPPATATAPAAAAAMVAAGPAAVAAAAAPTSAAAAAPTAAPTAAAAPAPATTTPSPAPPMAPSPPVSVTVSIPTSQVFSFVPASMPRSSTPPRPSVVCGPAPPCSPESPLASVAPPSPAKTLSVIAETPPLQSDPNRPHKRLHKKSKSRKLEGSGGSVVLPDEAGPEGAPPSLADSGPPQEQAPPHLEESVQSPAYSDISDDAAPLLEAAKDKEPPRASSELYGVYPYFGQPPYLLPGVQAPEGKPVSIAGPGSSVEEDPKKEAGSRDKVAKDVSRPQDAKKPEPDFPQFPPYSLCGASPFVQGAPGFPYDPYHVHLVEPPFKEDKGAPVSGKESAADKAPPPEKACPPASRPSLNPRRATPEPPPALTKDQLECKEEAKPEPKFSPYDSLYERRFLYLSPEQAAPTPPAPTEMVPKEVVHPPKSVVQHKSARTPKEHKEKEPAGQKPTMETTGPPPPANYAYLHPGYLPSHFSPHMAFESVYRGLPPPYGASPYLRFHVPPPEVPQQAPGPPVAPPPPKALDLLHQVSQHYGNHKIHELQERAVPSPSPHVGGERPPKGGPPEKGPPTSRGGSEGRPPSSGPPPPSMMGMGGGPDLAKGVLGGPGGGGGPLGGQQGPPGLPPGVAPPPPGSLVGAPNAPTDGSRSPPPQRHLHTHHHTHVGVGYPIYDPYGALIVSQQAAACAVAASSNLHPFVPK
ncbi:uncharacterized protein LOC144170278 isoform X3 [Haemaphysalis longicornis]